MPNGCNSYDSDLDEKKLWRLVYGCELSDLYRGMFEVAPRSAVIRG